MLDRRTALKSILAASVGAAGLARTTFAPVAEETVTLPIVGNGERPLVTYPGKRPLIRLTTRPPQLETPFSGAWRASSRVVHNS